MDSIRELMTENHRLCDRYFAAVEQAVADSSWEKAGAEFGRFQEAMQKHLDIEESLLFPAFEERTGMRMGPTQVMRGEHAQMRELMAAAGAALEERDADEYAGYAETLLIMTQQHNMKEENILYPMCDQHLMFQFDQLMPQLRSGIAGAERRE
jgi:hemerythrin-like domain-containing protein